MDYKFFRLDNSAIMYQMILTPTTQSIFRMGVKLSVDVNPTVLQQAIDKAFTRYPIFKTELKKGFFRPYLEETDLPFCVEDNDGTLLSLLPLSQKNRYLIKVSYHKKRIFIDYFHGLCDGTGAMEFLKTVIFYYHEILGIPFENKNILTLSTPIDEEEYEDAFEKYYAKPNLGKGVSKMAGGKAFGIKDKTFSTYGYGLTEMVVDTTVLLAKAHEFGCTITVLLTALMLYSVSKVYCKGVQKRNLTAFVPINLRKRYASKTICNFTVFAKIIIPTDVSYEFYDLIPMVKDILRLELDEKEVALKLGFTSLMSKIPFLKYLPLYFKSFVSKVGRKFSPTKQTFILSNLGNIAIDENGLIDEFMFNLNCSTKTPCNVGVVSYKNRTTIFFTRKIINAEIERVFAETLSALCGNVDIISNGKEND